MDSPRHPLKLRGVQRGPGTFRLFDVVRAVLIDPLHRSFVKLVEYDLVQREGQFVNRPSLPTDVPGVSQVSGG